MNRLIRGHFKTLFQSKSALKSWRSNERCTGFEMRSSFESFKSYRIRRLMPPAMNMDMDMDMDCLLYTSPSPRDATLSRMPSSA